MLAKKHINDEISNALKAVYILPITHLCASYQELAVLQPMCFPEPRNICVENVEQLDQYKQHVSELFQQLINFHNCWPQTFSTRFLLNSPVTRVFKVEQINSIFFAVESLNLSRSPNSLFEAIFSKHPLSEDLVQHLNQFHKKIIDIIELDDFSIVDKIKLINLLISARQSSLERVDQLIAILQYIHQRYPSLNKHFFKFFVENAALEQGDIFNETKALLDLLEDNVQLIEKFIFCCGDDIAMYSKILTYIKDIDVPDKENLLTIIVHSSVLKSSENANILEYVNSLVELSQQSHDEFALLSKLFENRPYPGFRKIQQYLSATVDERQAFLENYELDPPGLRSAASEQGNSEVLDKQFCLSRAPQCIDSIIDLDRQRPLFYGQRSSLMRQLQYINTVGRTRCISQPGFTDGPFDKSVIQLTKQQIQTLVNHYRKILTSDSASVEDKQIARLEFIALARESMYRTAEIFPYSTQILSVLNVALHGGSIFSEINTGEGKGLITALFAAVKWMEGGSVDVCSSNIELARRDLEEFNDFYDYLGIETGFIRASSTIDNYKHDGVNYSDISEMVLFQEKMQLDNEGLPDKVSLVLDESDSIVLDNATQFRYAVNLDANYNTEVNVNAWVYPVILAFVQRKGFVNNGKNAAEDVSDLRDFIQHSDAWCSYLSEKDKKNLVRLKYSFSEFPDVLLDRWIESAYAATQLSEGEDFVIRDVNVIRDGEEIAARVAQVKINHRISKESTFSNGVHQFLHARLNQEKLEGMSFLIEPEKTYLASKSAKNFVDYYLRPQSEGNTKRGDVVGLTGTIGSNEERTEMAKNYGFKFFKIPPHKNSLRVDRNYCVAKTKYLGIWPFRRREPAKQAHFRVIKEKVLQAHKLGQAILIICDGVSSSQDLYDYLLESLTTSSNLKLFNGEQQLDETSVVKRAGKPGSITISTPMLSRGTNIKPDSKGLYVIDTFISAERDYGQIIGRSGRNGMPGTSELILSEQEFLERDYHVPKDTQDVKKIVKEIQLKITSEKSMERYEYQVFSDIKEQCFKQYVDLCSMLKQFVRKNFEEVGCDYRQCWNRIQKDTHIQWESFLNSIDRDWNEIINTVHNEIILNPNFNVEKQLQKKILAFSKMVDTNFVKFQQSLASSLRSIFVTEYTTMENMQMITGQNSEIIVPEFPQFDKQKIQEKLDEISSDKQEFVLDITMQRLRESDFTPDRVYLDMLDDRLDDNMCEELSHSVMRRELQTIQQQLIRLIPQAKSSSGDEQANLSVVMSLFLIYRYSSLDTGLAKAKLNNLFQRTMNTVARYGSSEDKEKVHESYKEFISEIKNSSRSCFDKIVHEMHQLQKQGSIESGADLDVTKLLIDGNEQEVWQHLYHYAKEKLLEYLSEWWKASDRIDLAGKMKKNLQSIDSQLCIAPRQKAQQLLLLINEISQKALHKDFTVDSRSWFSVRNVKGSRFQAMLSAIRSQAIVVATVEKSSDSRYQEEAFDSLVHIAAGRRHPVLLLKQKSSQSQFEYLNMAISNLKQRASVFNSRNHSVIISFIEGLGEDIFLLNNDFDLSVNYTRLVWLKNYIFSYKNAFSSLNRNNPPALQSAFLHLIDDLYDQVITTEISVQNSINQAEINVDEHNLQSNIQVALHEMAVRNFVQAQNIPVTSIYHGVLSHSNVEKSQYLCVAARMYEIERHMRLSLSDQSTAKFAFLEISYDSSSQTLNGDVAVLNGGGQQQGSIYHVEIERLLSQPFVKQIAFVDHYEISTTYQQQENNVTISPETSMEFSMESAVIEKSMVEETEDDESMGSYVQISLPKGRVDVEDDYTDGSMVVIGRPQQKVVTPSWCSLYNQPQVSCREEVAMEDSLQQSQSRVMVS